MTNSFSTNTLLMWELANISATGTNGDPFPNNDNGLGTHDVVGGTFVIASGTTPVTVDVRDDDGYFSDGDGNQELAEDTTIDGVDGHAGQDFDPEYSYTVRPVGSTDPSDVITITLVEVEASGQQAVAIISDKPLGAGIEYEFIARVSTNPNIRYEDIADEFIPEVVQGLETDALTVTEDDGATDLDVFANDTLPDGATAVLVDDSGAPGGTVSISSDGILTFDPGEDFQSLGADDSVSFDVTYGIVVDTPLADPIHVEAEDLHLDNWSIKHGSQASGGELLKTHAHEASATLRDFDGPDGTYNLSLFFQDETDGKSTINVIVNGEIVDSFRLDRQSDGGGSNNGGFSEFLVENVALEAGDDLTIEGIRDGHEFLRFDRMILTQTEAAGAPALGDNLIVNGSFEDVAGLEVTGFGVQDDNGVIPGWSDDLGQAIDLHSDQRGGAVPVDGDFWLDLEASPANNVISQTVPGIDTARSYQLAFFMADSQPGHAADDNGVRVFWNGELVFEAEPTSNAFEEVVLTVDGGAGDGSGTLTFEGTGTLDNFGAAIDQVSLREISAAGDPIETETVTITVDGLNDDPVINGGPIAEATDEDTAVTFSVLANADDVDGDDVTIAAINNDDTLGDGVDVTSDGGLTGTVTVEPNGDLTFNPVPGFDPLGVGDTDTVSFEVTVSDGNGGTATETVTIDVAGLNDDPVINGGPIAEATDEDTAVTFSVLANADDVDGDDVTIAAINGDDTLGDGVDVVSAGGLTGTVTVEPNGDLTFNPVPGFDPLGVDDTDTVSFEVTVSDGNGGTATETVTIDVAGVNDDPVINGGPIAEATDEDTAVTFSVLANADDVDGDDVTIAAINGDDTLGDGVDVTSAGGLTGTVTVEPNGDLTFNPSPGFEALNDGDTDTVSFEVTVSDGNGGTATETVTIDVAGVTDNLPPIFIEPFVFFAAENETLVFGDEDLTNPGRVNAIDFDPGDELIFTLAGGEDAGLVSLSEDGALSLEGPIDFETPVDANGDNILIFNVDVTDGTETVTRLGYQINIQDVDEFVNSDPFFTFFETFGLGGAVQFDIDDPDLVPAFEPSIFSLDLVDSDGDGVLDTPFAVGDVNADDFDIPVGDTIEFSLQGQDAATFEIDADGEITVANDIAPNGSFNNDNLFEITVVATDSNGGSAQFDIEYTFFDVG